MQTLRFLVTGGSQGIGAAIVELARAAGHEVVFTGRNESLIEKLAQKTGAHRAACRRVGAGRQRQNRRRLPRAHGRDRRARQQRRLCLPRRRSASWTSRR